jgi:hypothetical protein
MEVASKALARRQRQVVVEIPPGQLNERCRSPICLDQPEQKSVVGGYRAADAFQLKARNDPMDAIRPGDETGIGDVLSDQVIRERASWCGRGGQ